MAIALRGTPTTGSAINGGNITLSLPAGLQQNDVVVVGYAMNAAGTGGTSSQGWTQIGANAGATTRIQVFRKVMGASPDASIVLTGTANAANSSTAIAIAFSGVSAVPEGGVALVSATGSSTNPDCGSITPNRTGSVVIAYAATSLIDTTGTGGPSGYSNFTQVSSNDNADTTSYMAWIGNRTAGVAENPSAFTGVSTAAWAGYTIALSPRLDPLTAAAGSYAVTGTAATPKHGWKTVAASGVYAITGASAGLAKGQALALGAGSYAVTGSAATLRKSQRVAAGVGSYVVSGANAAYLHGWRAAAAGGAYATIGEVASLIYGGRQLENRTVTAGMGSYAVRGGDVLLLSWRQSAAWYCASDLEATIAEAYAGLPDELAGALAPLIARSRGPDPEQVKDFGRAVAATLAQALVNTRKRYSAARRYLRAVRQRTEELERLLSAM